MNRDREAIAVRASELFSDEFCSAFDWPDEQSDAFFEKVGLMVGSAVERAFDELALPVGGGVEEGWRPTIDDRERMFAAWRLFNHGACRSYDLDNQLEAVARAALSPRSADGQE